MPCLSICVCVCVQVHLLCLLSYTLQQNRLCSDDFLQSVALSLLPSARISPETWRVSTLTDYVYWFRQILDIVPSLRRNGDMVRIAGSHTHTHPFNGPLSRTTQVSRYQKGKTNLDFTGARDSEWQWYQLGHASLHLAPDR